ncbi:efflux transporter outer membrane subunit [Klebsiella pneumoniae]|uniref:efflux transporter outer membrane subunit n=1 Tax=Klebsiella pneumoniae TaxID=573 RepID=UPI0021D9387C|nr:efflux transporter outer membrane subunit [Klebsiella pneumoniae]MCU8675169.1 efflux transporter outer membrane subunit [Klebsiella pneumoniae]MCU8688528.1 efflux transporter outer membrane subunit [Klebsiella pneumoniae]
MMRFSLILSVAALAGGCSLAPEYQRPAVPVAAQYPDYGQASGSWTIADIAWRHFYRDPLLQELIGQALANNRDLRIAALNVEAARATYRIQRGEAFPSLTADGSGTVQRTPADLAAGGESVVSRSYAAGATLSWELDLFGRMRSLNQQALELYLAQDETRVAARLALIGETASAWLTLQADAELLQLAESTLDAQRSAFQLVDKSYQQGVATALDRSQAEVGVSTAQRDVARYQRQRRQSISALILLLGQPPSPAMDLRLRQLAALPDDILPAEIPAGLPADLLRRRPDIRAAEHQLQAANANIGAARAAFFPGIVLTGSGGSASAGLDNLFSSGSGTWSFTPQIRLPIFSGGALRAGLDLAQVQKRIEVARYEQAIQQAFRETADALAGRDTLDAQILMQNRLVAATQRSYDLSLQRFQQGIDNYLSVLDSQRALYAAQQDLVNIRLARLLNLVDLYRALGGGWQEEA